MVENQILEIYVDDIYFLIGLSHRGELIYFGGRGGSEEFVDSYVNDFCTPRTRKKGGKLPIQHIKIFSLKTILFTMIRLEGSTSVHLASKRQVMISLRATDGVVFNWCLGLPMDVKDQITRYR